ncbi:MAG: hypothetical protein A2Y73_02435 [Chloroflexi bacterium RBG_13_56_8]|nr:MAG: hypothetical protein A2Y73_02435 [Chloroflexi bacterium RBG_13_56_8]
MMSQMDYWLKDQQARGVDIDAAKAKLKKLDIHVPLWLYRDTGTRFGRVHQEDSATADNIFEVAAALHKITGCLSSIVAGGAVAPEDVARTKARAEANGLKVSTVHGSYTTSEGLYYGSLTNATSAIRKEFTEYMLKQIEAMRVYGAKYLSIWLPDGTNFPGQGNFIDRKKWLIECLQEAYDHLDPDMIMLLEYKFFEPAFYHTDISDWGTACALCRRLGPQAKVIMDFGHHAQGTNVEHILANLIDENMLGALHVNASKYGDDDLIAGAHQPYRLFLIFLELVLAERYSGFDMADIALTVDQCLTMEKKMPGTIMTVENVQIAYAKALLVNLDKLKELQMKNDVVGAAMTLKDAFECDVRPLLRMVRAESGLPVDPFAAVAGL